MSENKKIHLTSIGGQAIIEGVMMRGPKEIAMAVRKPNGEIIVDKKPVSSIVQKYKLLKIPIVRGVISFIESLVIGIKALTFSANFFEMDEGEEGEPKEPEKLSNVLIYLTVAFSLMLGIGLFFMLPLFLVRLVESSIPNDIVKNLAEGGVRLLIFLIYVVAISRMKDIRRVFEYHGAEHKSIHCYEKGEDLTTDNIKAMSRLHPRCGTSFLLIVMVVSILIFTMLPSGIPLWQRAAYRLSLLPVVAGLSYEVIKFAGRKCNWFTKLISAPGIWMQYLTTREPDESQIEVAVAALTAVMPENKEDDKW